MALIAHYTLDRQANIKPNMCSRTNTSSSNWYYGGANGAYSHYQIGQIHHFVCTRKDTSWQFLSYNNFDRGTVEANKKYTISFKARANVSTTMSVRFLNDNGTQTMSNSVTMNNITGKGIDYPTLLYHPFR